MSWAFVDNNKIEEVHYFLPRNWRNISNFNLLTKDMLLNVGWYEIIEKEISYDQNTQEIYDHEIIMTENGVERIPLIRDKTQIEQQDVI